MQYISKKTHTFANNMKVKQFTYKWITFTIIYFCLYDVIWALADYEDFKKAYKDYCVWLLIDLAYCALFSFTSILINQMLFKLRRFHTIKNGLSFFIINSVFVIASNLLTAGVCETLIAYFDPAIIENDIWGTSFLFGIISSLIALIYLSLYYSEMAIKNNNDKLSLQKKYLKLQLDPHFVFNVLETIHMRCVEAGLKDLSRMVTDLAQLLRGNMGAGGGSQKITFAQELDYVRYYMDLQQSRFGAANLHFSVDYEDEDILHCLVPRLTIQPLVENAVVHGLEPRRGLGSVMVRLWEEDSSICVRVEDDGVGFDPAEVDLEKAQEAGRHNHIALPNILRRLNLLYGDQASLTIRSHPGSGTQIMLALPIDKEM